MTRQTHWDELRAAGRLEQLRQEAAVAAAAGETLGLLYLGVAALDADRPQEALEPLQRFLALHPDHGAALYNLGLCLQRLDRPLEAARFLRRSIVRGGDRPEVWNALGHVLADLGQTEAALTCHERALCLDPTDAEAHFTLARARRHTQPPPWLSKLAAAFEDSHRPADQRARLGFALGKILDDLGRHEAAMGAYRTANALLGPSHDEAGLAAYDTALRRAFPGPVHPMPGATGRPVLLVVGMPRSGTTLLAQCLSRHPAIHSVGEGAWLRDTLEATGYPWRWADLTPETRLQAGRAYVGHLPREPRWILDKTPLNGFHLGAVGQVLAGAKVIFCRRHPLDVGLSCFFQCFTQGHEYSRDLGALGRFMRRYLDLLDFWRARLPADRWLDLAYEDLVHDQERTLRRVTDFLGLPWDSACLDHRGNTRPVHTASKWQVREPLYTRSIGRWQPYLPWLGPLLAGLAGERGAGP